MLNLCVFMHALLCGKLLLDAYRMPHKEVMQASGVFRCPGVFVVKPRQLCWVGFIAMSMCVSVCVRACVRVCVC